MYTNLLYGVKRRILQEVEDSFLNHPAFSAKVKVSNKFPYEERVQYGVILRNSSAAQMRMSADNYLADLSSHVRLARDANYPGLAIEWVRENTNEVTSYRTEMIPGDPTQRLYSTSLPIASGRSDTTYAVSSQQIDVQIGNHSVSVESVDGSKKQFVLSQSPAAGSTLAVSYWARTIAPPGIYVIDFTENNQFVVGPVYIVTSELLIEKTTGLETGTVLAHTGVYPGTDELVLKYAQEQIDGLVLQKDVDYTIDYVTGQIIFLRPLNVNYKLFADYRWQTGDSWGPFTFEDYQEVHDAIPGVVICLGRRAKKGDRQVVITSEFRESQAKIYGGHYDMSLSLGVIAKDTMQMEEMTDQIVSYLWGIRKNVLEFEGITMTRVEPTGESEESFIETTGDLYFESTVDIQVMTEWQRFVPYLCTIRHIALDLVLVDDIREVIKYPTVGYERVI